MKLFLASSVNTVGSSIVKSLGKKRRVLFINTAGEIYKDPWWNIKDVKVLKSLGCRVREYTVTGKKAKEVKNEVLQHDIVCVGGGNTWYLLAHMQKSGALKVIQDAVRAGMPYIGSSAGTCLACGSIDFLGDLDDKSEAPKLRSSKALGFTDLSILPHWGSESLDHTETTLKVLKNNARKKEKFILLRDDQYVEVQDDFYKIVTTK